MPVLWQLLKEATYVRNEASTKAVTEILTKKGVTDIQHHQYWNQTYWKRRVPQIPPPAAILASNISQVYELCQQLEAFQEILVPKVHHWFQKYIRLARDGRYQPPSDSPTFTHVGFDADGLPLYNSEQGTGRCENVHKIQADLAGPFGLGMRTGHYLLAERLYRYNE